MMKIHIEFRDGLITNLKQSASATKRDYEKKLEVEIEKERSKSQKKLKRAKYVTE